MKNAIKIALCALLIGLFGACSRSKVIPDDTLARIFHDAFLANAYMNQRTTSLDSLKIYEPIFAQYGYTAADVHYTIGNFSKRKSERLGDVVEKAIEILDAENSYYTREVSILDTVNNIARRSFTRTIYSDTLIRIHTLRDTSKLRLKFEMQPGEYEIRLKYLVDSLDKNGHTMRGIAWIEQRDSSRSNQQSVSLRRDQQENFIRRFTADSTSRFLRLNFVEFREKPKKPSVTITDLELRYTPPTTFAVDSLYDKQLNIRIFAERFFATTNQTDSL